MVLVKIRRWEEGIMWVSWLVFRLRYGEGRIDFNKYVKYIYMYIGIRRGFKYFIGWG